MGANVQTAAVAAILLAGVGLTVPLFVSGYQYSIVLTASMEPAISVGDVVAIEPASPDGVDVGEVMAFHAPDNEYDAPVIHRVVEIEHEDGRRRFHTKGDNLEERDPWVVPEDNVLGQVAFTIPWIGHVVNLLRSGNRILYVLLIAGPAVGLVGDEIRKLLGEDEAEPVEPSWITPIARRVHDRYSDLDEAGVEQSMIAWVADRFLPEDGEKPFIVVEDA